jgi:hypothetical protein
VEVVVISAVKGYWTSCFGINRDLLSGIRKLMSPMDIFWHLKLEVFICVNFCGVQDPSADEQQTALLAYKRSCSFSLHFSTLHTSIQIQMHRAWCLVREPVDHYKPTI